LNMLQVTNAFGLPLALRLQPIGGNSANLSKYEK
jgi:hypothetical protein